MSVDKFLVNVPQRTLDDLQDRLKRTRWAAEIDDGWTFGTDHDDSIIVSVRHQDSVMKFSRATGRITWILGPHDNWGPPFQPYLLTPVGTPFEWQYHQHAPMLTPQGTLLLMDNGNYRASPFDGRVPMPAAESYSRAVEYAIDETTMQVQQVWEYGTEIPWRLYSSSQGDADRMPQTGNVLITFSDTRFLAGVAGSAWGLGTSHTSIVEVTHTSPGQIVFAMDVYDPDPASHTFVYRSERIPRCTPQPSASSWTPIRTACSTTWTTARRRRTRINAIPTTTAAAMPAIPT